MERTFFIDLVPKGKARHRQRVFTVEDKSKKLDDKSRFKHMASTYADPKQKDYVRWMEAEIREAWIGCPLLTGPVRVWFTAFMPIPKSWNKKISGLASRNEIAHTSKPDLDNLEKMLFDCMNGIVWKDDAQVVEVTKLKKYSSSPGWYVTVVEVPV